MDDGENTRTAARNRREVLAGAVAVGLVTAGCAAGGTPDRPTTGMAPAPDAPAPGSGATGTELGGATDVPVGGGTVFEALEVVVTQPAAGDYRGLSAICTHTGCIVNKVADGLIACPCHGSRYHLDGSVAKGPAPRALAARPVRVENGQIVLE